MMQEHPIKLSKFRCYIGVTHIINCALITRHRKKINYNLFGKKLSAFLNPNAYISRHVRQEITINNKITDTLFM